MLRRVTLLSQTPEQVTFVGDPQPAAGWYGPNAGWHTVSIKTQNFSGRLQLQGTLVQTPQEGDWFPLPLNPLTVPVFDTTQQPYVTKTNYIQFPISPVLDSGIIGESSTIGYQFRVDCIWLRATFDRSYLVPSLFSENELMRLGQIDSIIVMY